MYCQYCGSELTANLNACSNCGKTVPGTENATPVYHEAGRGVMILILGIISLVSLGPILGIPAWVMGYKDLKKIKAGIIAASEKSMTQAGMILGIISTVLYILIFILFILFLIIVVMAESGSRIYS
jgi:hypothetical protein